MRKLKFFIGPLIVVGTMWGCFGKSSDVNNHQPSALLGCPASPNCVSSLAKDSEHRIEPFHLRTDPETSWDEIKSTVASLPRTTIVSASLDSIQAECRSMIFRFVDDLTLHLSPAENIVHIRSASRTGYFDFGVNFRRVENLREQLRQRGIIE